MQKLPFPFRQPAALRVAPRRAVRKDDAVALRTVAGATLKERGPCDKAGTPCLLGDLEVGSAVHVRVQGKLMPAVVTSLNPFAVRSV
jgi:hypothetical protein